MASKTEKFTWAHAERLPGALNYTAAISCREALSIRHLSPRWKVIKLEAWWDEVLRNESKVCPPIEFHFVMDAKNT